jgi:hypothetical protein
MTKQKLSEWLRQSNNNESIIRQIEAIENERDKCKADSDLLNGLIEMAEIYSGVDISRPHNERREWQCEHPFDQLPVANSFKEALEAAVQKFREEKKELEK